MKPIAFIGLGNMGLPMVANLIKAGHRVHAADVRSEAVEAAVAQGAVAARSAADATRHAEVVVTMVPNSPEVEVAYLAAGGVLEGARRGQIAIDMSTIDPATTRKVGARRGSGCSTLPFRAECPAQWPGRSRSWWGAIPPCLPRRAPSWV